MDCGCCGDSYTEDNDLLVFGTLTDANGVKWPLCGPCVQTLWAERRPELEPLDR